MYLEEGVSRSKDAGLEVKDYEILQSFAPTQMTSPTIKIELANET